VTTDQILDRVLVPRPNGSEALDEVQRFLADALRAAGGTVDLQPFAATPHGFALCWAFALAAMLAWAIALDRRRFALALVPLVLVPVGLLAEFEWLRSPVSGLWPATGHNVIGEFPGRPGGPLLVFVAHADTTTHFGDHRDWGPWGWRMGPALGLAFAITLADWLFTRRRGRPLPRTVVWLVVTLVLAPFAAMAWFQTAGPLLRAPSPGALDNGGSLAALVRLAERLDGRGADAAATLRIVFVAGEEERALGSRAHARSLERDRPLAIFNLESVGASGALAFVPEDGFELRRFQSPTWLRKLVDAAAGDLGRPPLSPLPIPMGTLTDGRSYLAEGLPALTLRASVDGTFPTRLHSVHDSRDRLSVPAIEQTVDLLAALVRRVDREPESMAAALERPDR